MRSIVSLLLLSVLILTACGGGGGEATTAPQNPTPETSVQPTPEATDPNAGLLQQLEADPNAQPEGVPGVDETSLEVPLPGTLVASVTEDVDAALIFDQIYATQSGGPNNVNLLVQVSQDGTVLNGDSRVTVSQEEILAVDAMIDSLNFFGMQGTFLGPAADATVYRYTLTVVRGSSERMIQAQDGFMPPELQALLARVLALGQPTGPG